MSTLFTRHSPGALTLREAVELEKKRAAAECKRRKQQAEAEALAREGRGGTGQGGGGFASRRRRSDGKEVTHAGVDFAVPPGKAIAAPGAGTIVSTDPQKGYGNQITIDHGNGIFSQVAHIGDAHVRPGDRVTTGQVIGISGDPMIDNVGNAEGKNPQVHFEIRGGDGRPRLNGGFVYNPFDYLPPLNPHD